MKDAMTSLVSRRDLDFMLYEWLDIGALTARPRFAEHSRETFDAVLDLSAEIAAKYFVPHNKKADRSQPWIDDDGKVVLLDDIRTALKEFNGAGLTACQFDRHLGGLQLPATVDRAAMALFTAANAATTAYPLLTVANANLLVEYGTPEQVDTWVRPMLEGRSFGTICLTEPQAGSSLGDIATRAVAAADDTYRITGTKMFISGGDHELSENIIHLVLAKTPGGGAGVAGISLFLVPKLLPDGTRNDVSLVRLNHKMGNRGTTNTILNFGDGTYRPAQEPGAVGYLVGELHCGLSQMFHMMNETRIGVGIMASALGYAGYIESVRYAKDRRQGRATAANCPASPPVPLIEHADVRHMLLAQKAYVEGALALGLYCSSLVDEQKTGGDQQARQARVMLGVLTPIAKSWSAQWCLHANNLAMQVYGGYGYTSDFPVEQFYRDNRINTILEGTHGIQGLDLLGRKVVRRDGEGVAALRAVVMETVDRARARGRQLSGYAEDLRSALDRLLGVTATLWAADDVAVTLANSSIYLEAAGHVVIAWIWLEQLLAVGDKHGDFYDGKRIAAQYFYRFELPHTSTQFDLLARMDRTVLDVDADWF